MISVTLARRYARALLHLAERQKQLDRTHEELNAAKHKKLVDSFLAEVEQAR